MPQYEKRSTNNGCARVQFSTRFPVPLADAVDRAAREAGVNRNEWLIAVAEAVLASAELKQAALAATARR
jgi:hypothetical protein